MRNVHLLYDLRKRTKKTKRHDTREINSWRLHVNAQITDLNVTIIRSFREKFVNLIQIKNIDIWTCYLIRNAHAFNSFGLFYQCDVVFCNKNFQVVEMIKNFHPQKVSHYFKSVHFVYCFAPGMIKYLDLKKNDIVRYH